MSETWSKELCPACKAANWLLQLAEDDIDAYTCWSCKAEIRLLAGEMLDEYKPHVEGTEPTDNESVSGVHRDGKEGQIRSPATEMWDALCASRTWLLWAKERGASCDHVISEVNRLIAANRVECAPYWSRNKENQ